MAQCVKEIPGDNMQFTSNPFEVIAHNDKFRKYFGMNGIGLDILTLDQFNNMSKPSELLDSQIMIPEQWEESKSLTQDEFCDLYKIKFPEVFSILPIENVFIAGGSACWPFGKHVDQNVSDVDIFITGINPDDRRAMWKKVYVIVSKLRRAFTNHVRPIIGKATHITEKLDPGVFTLQVYYNFDSHCSVKIQIILRAYESISSTIHGFDIPSCSIAFDGVNTYMTYMAAWTIAYRTIIINPDYNSTSYSHRIIKYFKRGFACVFPHMRVGLLEENVEFKLPFLTILPTKIQGNLAYGSLNIIHTNRESVSHDYNPDDNGHSIMSHPGFNENFTTLTANIKSMVSKNNRFTVKKSFSCVPVRGIPIIDLGIPLDTFHEANEPNLSTIIPKQQFSEFLFMLASKFILLKGNLNIMALKSIFDLNEKQIGCLAISIINARTAQPNCSIDMASTLSPFCIKLNAIYDSVSKEIINWWIIHNPMDQFIGSLRAEHATPSSWYGDAYDANSILVSHATTNIRKFIEDICMVKPTASIVYVDTCALCLSEVNRGSPNSVVCGCGHVFHWKIVLDECGEKTICCGVHKWFIDNETCPTCRYDFSEKRKAKKNPVTTPLVFSI